MVNPEGASHWREVFFVREVTQFRVNVWPSSTVMASMFVKAAVEGEIGEGQAGRMRARGVMVRRQPQTLSCVLLPSESHD